MLKTVVIGIGNAGGNVAKLVNERAKFPAIAINTSNQDLSAIGQSIPTKVFGDGKGIGKNRDGSKEELKKSITTLISDPDMSTMLADAELIFVVSSCGGGTGSGTALIVATIIGISYPNAAVVPIGIVPQLEEGLGSQLNFIDYYEELRGKITETSYMIYDNGQFTGLPHQEVIQKVNEQIALHIQILSGMFNNQTNLDSIDDRDMLTIISAPGRIVVADATDLKERDIDTSKAVEQRLIDSIKNGANAEPQRDGRITTSGVIANISDKIPFDPMIPTVQDYIGVPVDTFQHVSINRDKGMSNDVYLILSGLSLIRDRKDRVAEVIKEKNAKQDAIRPEEDDDLRELRSLQGKRVRSSSQQRREKVTSTFDDVFKSFGL